MMTRQDTQDTMNLRRVPMGLKGNVAETLKFLSECKATELRLYCVLQQESKWNNEENHRFIDYSDHSLQTYFELAKMSKPTGYANIKKLETKGFIKLHSYKDFSGQNRKVIKLPKKDEHTYVLCNLDVHLYKMLQQTCKPVVIKVYLLHCFMASINSKSGCVYNISLHSIATKIGYSNRNLEIITECNNLLKSLGIIEIEKNWTKKQDEIHCKNTYVFHRNRVQPE